jgi:hypothetical protein
MFIFERPIAAVLASLLSAAVLVIIDALFSAGTN